MNIKQTHLIGSSPAIQHIDDLITRAARSSAPVLIMGETGTGKELCAHGLHARSARAKAPFLALNCAALPRDLIEAELFGHAPGAFTGAGTGRAGFFAAAQGGTLFLDEIAEMDMYVQAKLLRVLQDQVYYRLGETTPRRIRARIICATNRTVSDLLDRGLMREDLYYRLNAITLHLPPLRDRRTDIPDLAQHFLDQMRVIENKHFDTIELSVMNALSAYHWPGNVRQLQNTIRHAVVFHTGPILTLDMLPTAISRNQARSGPQWHYVQQPANMQPQQLSDRTSTYSLAEIEREAITSALKACGENIQAAAIMLDIAPSTIYRKLSMWKK